MKVVPVAENAVLLSFGDRVDAQLTPHIMALTQLIETELVPAVIDLTPSYTTLLVTYDLLRIDQVLLIECIHRLHAQLTDGSLVTVPGRCIEIPVWYDPAVGLDLIALADARGLSVSEVIERHTRPVYQVYALGFAPGFGFLGEVDPSLATPRKATPRAQVPAGSVAIAERQTAVYPRTSPGGWQIIGRTAMTLFDPHATDAEAATLHIGDQVRFVAISEEAFYAQGGER
ncbi:MAG: 5-oxoprolinase subunit PxpB [Natronospirillum sp.]